MQSRVRVSESVLGGAANRYVRRLCQSARCEQRSSLSNVATHEFCLIAGVAEGECGRCGERTFRNEMHYGRWTYPDICPNCNNVLDKIEVKLFSCVREPWYTTVEFASSVKGLQLERGNLDYEVLRLLSKGVSKREIARRLGLSRRAVDRSQVRLEKRYSRVQEPRMCACGCSEELPTARKENLMWFSNACRQRGLRSRRRDSSKASRRTRAESSPPPRI